MAKKQTSPEAGAAGAGEVKEKKVKCMYCGKSVPASEAVDGKQKKVFCSETCEKTYADTMHRLHQDY